MAVLFSGKAAAAALREGLTARAAALLGLGITPTLAVLRVGERPDDLAYEAGAKRGCEKLGVGFRSLVLPDTAATEEALDAVQAVNGDGGVHGCLLLRPLPKHMDETRIRNSLAAAKDVDGITDASLAGVFTGSGAGYAPCTAQACVELLDYYGVDPAGKNAVVVGRSLVVGRPLGMLLLNRNATVTLCHTRTADLPVVCRRADLLIAAAGKPGMLTSAYVRPGQTVVDVGMQLGKDGRLTGDVAFSEAEPIVSAITPVPGGVGAVTTAVLLKHVVEAAEKAAYEERRD